MTTTWMAGVIASAALLCWVPPSPAQDKGKTEAAERASVVDEGMAKTTTTKITKITPK